MLEVGKGKEEGTFILSLIGQAGRGADVPGTVLGTKDTGRRRRHPAFEEDASSKRGRWPAHIAAGLIDALTGVCTLPWGHGGGDNSFIPGKSEKASRKPVG